MTFGGIGGQVAETVEWLIADTFDIPIGSVTQATRPGEVSGWDSLGHSVLLTRVSHKLKLPLSEELAAPVDTVGEFIQRLVSLVDEPAHG